MTPLRIIAILTVGISVKEALHVPCNEELYSLYTVRVTSLVK